MPSNLNDGDGTESEDPSTVSWAASGGFPATRPFFSSGFRSRKSGDRGGAEEKRSIFFPVFIFQILSPFSCILPFLGLLDVRLVAAAEGWSTGGAGGRVAAEGFDRSLSCGWALRGRREGMGWETTQGVGEGSCSPSPSAAPATPSCSPNGKRSRDATEDEVYLDNFHSHKRYLSEIMACSLNGLSVGETLTENLMESPARSDTSMCYHTRDELASQYSPMSEDSDDTRCYDPQVNAMAGQPDGIGSSSSPVSPHRCPRHQMGSAPSAACPLAATACSHPRRGADAEARFPSSPNDACHTGDLRRTALLRSVQMRAQPHGSPPAYELSFTGMASAEEGDRSCSCPKNADDESEYHRPPPQFPGLLEEGPQAGGPPSSHQG